MSGGFDSEFNDLLMGGYGGRGKSWGWRRTVMVCRRVVTQFTLTEGPGSYLTPCGGQEKVAR